MAAAKLRTVVLALCMPTLTAAGVAALVVTWPSPPATTPLDRTPPETVRLADVFPLLYKARNTMPDSSVEYQLNDRVTGKTHFVKVGEQVNGYIVSRHEEAFEERYVPSLSRTGRVDCSRLVLERDGKEIILVRGRETSSNAAGR